MKKIQRIYYILTYTFFIYPPFIWGLVEIYFKGDPEVIHLVSLYVNLILIAVITIICGALIYYKKLHLPNELERKYLVFGLIGNIVIYFYTFQNFMHIDNIVTVYGCLLIILGVHYLLIAKKLYAKELWVLASVFLIVDSIHLAITKCGYVDYDSCVDSYETSWFLYILYVILVFTILSHYIYKIYLYKMVDFFKILNIIMVTIMSVLFQIEMGELTDFMLTLMILIPFAAIIDFIVKIVNKNYTHKMLLFYTRSFTILIVLGMLGSFEFFIGGADFRILSLMVIVIYVSLFLNIIKMLLKIDIESPTKHLNKNIRIIKCNEEILALIKEQFGEKHARHIKLSDQSCSLVAMENNIVVGFISTYIKPLAPPLEGLTEAYINIIEVIEEYRKQGIGSTLVRKTEDFYKNSDVTQIRGWSSDDKVEAIKLWNNLNYGLSPAKIWMDNKDLSCHGYYFVKKIK